MDCVGGEDLPESIFFWKGFRPLLLNLVWEEKLPKLEAQYAREGFSKQVWCWLENG